MYLRLIPDVAHYFTVQICTQVHSFEMDRPINFKLSLICTVLHDVSEFVQNICPLTGLLTARVTARQSVLRDYRQLTLMIRGRISFPLDIVVTHTFVGAS